MAPAYCQQRQHSHPSPTDVGDRRDAGVVMGCLERTTGGLPVARVAGTIVVYIVDDDDAVRDGFTRLLRAAGLDPRPYGSSELFLDEVTYSPDACVLLDITMPHLNGPEVQARLNSRRIELPVITVSARDDDETRTWARALGARMFLRKPVDDQALLDAIHWVIDANDDHP